MIRTSRLNVRVALIQAKINEPGLGFVVPFVLTVPEFSRARLERNTVECHAKPCALSGPGYRICLWLERDAERVTLR